MHIRTSELLQSADQQMTDILRRMNAEQQELRNDMMCVQEELRKAKENIEQLLQNELYTELKEKVMEHDEKLKILEEKGKRNISTGSLGYHSMPPSREPSLSNLPLIPEISDPSDPCDPSDPSDPSIPKIKISSSDTK